MASKVSVPGKLPDGKVAPFSRIGAAMSAQKMFAGFKPEEEKEIRSTPEISILDEQRQKREMLRGMSADQLMQVLEIHDNMSFFDALEYAERQGKVIAPNSCVDKLFRDCSSETWTGTAIITEVPGKPFGDTVEFFGIGMLDYCYSLSYAVPADFRGRADCAIVIEHPDFKIVAVGENRYSLEADRKDAVIIEGYPARRKSSWTVRFVTDPCHGIPCGDADEYARARRAFDNIPIQFSGSEDPYVGMVFRSTSFSSFNSSQTLSAFANLRANMTVAFY